MRRLIAAFGLLAWLCVGAAAQPTGTNTVGSSSLVVGTTPVTGSVSNCILYRTSTALLACAAGLTTNAAGEGVFAGSLGSNVSGFFDGGGFGVGHFGPGVLVANSAANYGWSSNANFLLAAADTGLARNAAGVVEANTGTNGVFGTFKAASFAPGTIYSAAGTPLPSCAAGTNGYTAIVSDTTAPTYRSAYTSGGAVTGRVLCISGTGWIND